VQLLVALVDDWTCAIERRAIVEHENQALTMFT
jgi:hypothetical protein